jgi:hypothetical protein
VRTGFSRLQSEGWTEISPSSGTFVRGLSPAEITEILEARILLESYLAGRAAKMMSETELVRLRNAFSAFGERVAADRTDEYLELDLQFHLSIYKAAANSVLSDVLLNLIDKARWIRRASAGYPSRSREAFSEFTPFSMLSKHATRRQLRQRCGFTSKIPWNSGDPIPRVPPTRRCRRNYKWLIENRVRIDRKPLNYPRLTFDDYEANVSGRRTTLVAL